MYQALYHGSPVWNVCKEFPYEKSIAFHAPKQVILYWDFELNKQRNRFPQYTPANSNQKIFVKCDQHKWEGGIKKSQRCADLKEHIPCPFCSNKEATPFYNLAVFFLQLQKNCIQNTMQKKYSLIHQKNTDGGATSVKITTK